MYNGCFQERRAESLSNLCAATCRDVCQQIWRKQKSFRCAECSEWPNFCRRRTDSIVQPLKGTGENEDRGWGGGAGKFSNARGERASLQQKADAGRFTLHRITGWPGYHLHPTWGALYADRSNRTGGGVTEGVKKRAVSVWWWGECRGEQVWRKVEMLLFDISHISFINLLSRIFFFWPLAACSRVSLLCKSSPVKLCWVTWPLLIC